MKLIIKITLLIYLIISSLHLYSQQSDEAMAGSWQGVLNTGAGELRIVFNLSLNENGNWKATMDSPDQGAMGIPLGDVLLTNDSIRIEAPALLGYYNGKITSPSSSEGTWYQAGRSFKLDLEKREEAIVLNRPQEPRPPYPYMEEELRFQNKKEGFMLAGTLSLPEGPGPFPAVILVSGSGSQNRDEEIFGHKPFRVIADHLTRNGIAVLRYDDRGVGKSGGNAAGSTTEDLAEDARGALDFLFTRDDIDPARIGIIGHSEGGMIAFMLASALENLRFVVSMAGPGVDGKTILLDQSEHIARLSGVAPAILEDNRYVMNGVYERMIANISYEDWKEETLNFTTAFYAEKAVGSYSEADIEGIRSTLLASIPESSYAWMRYFVMFDPAALFTGISCPVLALNGEKDSQVLPEQNIAAIKMGLERAGNHVSDTMILPGLNHLFQNCITGLPNEYATIEETFDPATLELISNWIWQQVR
jgi:pimeloyl-ACP methyl ester carboxylesterase